MEKFKRVNITLNLGVGFYKCGLSVRLYEGDGTACIVDHNAITGCAIIELDHNPSWADLLRNADDNETIIIDGSVYDQTYAEVKDLTVRKHLSPDGTKLYGKGIIMPKAYDYKYNHTFRRGYFGAAVDKPRGVYISPSKIIRTSQVNEYQVYQNGYTFTICHNNFNASQDGRLRINVRGIMVIDYTHNGSSEMIYDHSVYAEFCNAKDPAKIPNQVNYITRLINSLIYGWHNREDPNKVVKDEFSSYLAYSEYDEFASKNILD